MPPFDSKDVANTILDLGRDREIPLSPMKLQKLLFFSHGWHLAVLGTPLLNEPIQAWDFGPVVASVYHEFKGYGRGPIEGRASRFHFESNDMVSESLPKTEETEQSMAVIEKVWEIYSSYSAIQLSNMTHDPDSPWSKVIAASPKPIPRGIIIPDKEIETYFASKAA